MNIEDEIERLTVLKHISVLLSKCSNAAPKPVRQPK
jgi:hypothetical protein